MKLSKLYKCYISFSSSRLSYLVKSTIIKAGFCVKNLYTHFFNRHLTKKSHFSAILLHKIFSPAVVSADTRLAGLMLPLLLQLGLLYLWRQHIYSAIYSRETVSLLYICGTAGSFVWPVKAMLEGCDLHTYILKTCLHHRGRRRSGNQHACARLGIKLPPL